MKLVAPETHPDDGNWVPGDAPSQVLEWGVEAVAKAGTLSIIGVYPQTMKSFPLGQAVMKNLTLQMGNCNHRKYIPILVELVRSGMVDPVPVLSQRRAADVGDRCLQGLRQAAAGVDQGRDRAEARTGTGLRCGEGSSDWRM